MALNQRAPTSTHERLELALKLAKREEFEQSKQMLVGVVLHELSPDDLHTFARVTSRCELFEDNVNAWLELERRGEMLRGE